MTDEVKKLIEDLKKSPFRRVLILFLEEKTKELDNVDDIKSFDEVLGRKHAKKIIKELCAFLESDKSQGGKNQYS